MTDFEPPLRIVTVEGLAPGQYLFGNLDVPFASPAIPAGEHSVELGWERAEGGTKVTATLHSALVARAEAHGKAIGKTCVLLTTAPEDPA